ncbi:hypothetical protein [Hydrogenophaga sp.]|jgi:hypothetical protein|uniref:hypothetical protein n=1 Tax=Hydrogenophaga sp. TaxID=1904254 RepID=UPI003BAF72C7
MLIQYTVLLLLDTSHGSLAEIELTQPVMPSGSESQWLWIEGNTVTTLQVIGSCHPSKRIFDRAVLTLGGERGELQWPSGRTEVLSINSARALRPDFRRLVHQHLN